MLSFVSITLFALAVMLAVPVVVFLAEVLAAVTLPPRDALVAPSEISARPRVAILVPAHNEGVGSLPTLSDIKAQMHPGDRLLVVADNCTDDTAAVAAAAEAEVLERNDPDRKGKGYALACGIEHLGNEPPDIVIIVDADCRLVHGTVGRLTTACTATHRPVQALDLMIAPSGSPINLRVAEFAWRIKNWVRPLGLRALGLPCQLMGTGMAFPWDVIRSVNFASGLIVEDLKLGLDLASAGHPPMFCPTATVTSEFPQSAGGVQSQRLRWEQGHIGLIVTSAPRYILAALSRANWPLLILAVDMAVPPLSLLGMLVAGMWVITGLAFLVGASSAAVWVSTASLAGFSVGVFGSWLTYGRDILPSSSILQMLFYTIGKLPLYLRIFLRKSGSQWVRTDRGKKT